MDPKLHDHLMLFFYIVPTVGLIIVQKKKKELHGKKVGIADTFCEQSKSMMNDVTVAVRISSSEVAYAVVDHDLFAKVQGGGGEAHPFQTILGCYASDQAIISAFNG